MSRPESHIFGLTHAQKVTVISAPCHLLKKAIIVKYYCHNSKVYQAMSTGLLTVGYSSISPLQLPLVHLETTAKVQKERIFSFVSHFYVSLLGNEMHQSRTNTQSTGLFIYRTNSHGILSYLFTLHQFLPFFVVRVP